MVPTTVWDYTSILVYNDRWRNGIASSIQEANAGPARLCACRHWVVLMNCDHSRLKAEHLRGLNDAFSASDAKVIAASVYAGDHGVPAVFLRVAFGELHALQGGRGAQSIIQQAVVRWLMLSLPVECEMFPSRILYIE